MLPKLLILFSDGLAIVCLARCLLCINVFLKFLTVKQTLQVFFKQTHHRSFLNVSQ